MCRHSYSPSHEKSEKMLWIVTCFIYPRVFTKEESCSAPQNIWGLGPLKALIRPCLQTQFGEDKNENYVVHLKGLSILKKAETASKSAYKRQRNVCSNYAPLERTARRPRSVTKKNKINIQTPYFRTYSRRALHDLPQALHGDRARSAYQKRCKQYQNRPINRDTTPVQSISPSNKQCAGLAA